MPKKSLVLGLGYRRVTTDKCWPIAQIGRQSSREVSPGRGSSTKISSKNPWMNRPDYFPFRCCTFYLQHDNLPFSSFMQHCVCPRSPAGDERNGLHPLQSNILPSQSFRIVHEGRKKKRFQILSSLLFGAPMKLSDPGWQWPFRLGRCLHWPRSCTRASEVTWVRRGPRRFAQ